MARMTNKNSVAVLDEADRSERILNWQLFCIEQEQMLWGAGPGSTWRPGDIGDLPSWLANRAHAENRITVSMGMTWDGNWGNHHRHMFDLFAPGSRNAPADQRRFIEDDGGDGEIWYESIDWETERKWYKSYLARQIPGHSSRQGVCMDCEVAFDLKEEQECFVCGKQFEYHEPKPAVNLVFDNQFNIAPLRPQRQDPTFRELLEPVIIPGCQADRVVEFFAEYDIDFHRHRFMARCGQFTQTVIINTFDLEREEDLPAYLMDIKRDLVEALREMWRRVDSGEDAMEEEPLSDWERELLDGGNIRNEGSIADIETMGYPWSGLIEVDAPPGPGAVINIPLGSMRGLSVDFGVVDEANAPFTWQEDAMLNIDRAITMQLQANVDEQVLRFLWGGDIPTYEPPEPNPCFVRQTPTMEAYMAEYADAWVAPCLSWELEPLGWWRNRIDRDWFDAETAWSESNVPTPDGDFPRVTLDRWVEVRPIPNSHSGNRQFPGFERHSERRRR